MNKGKETGQILKDDNSNLDHAIIEKLKPIAKQITNFVAENSVEKSLSEYKFNKTLNNFLTKFESSSVKLKQNRLQLLQILFHVAKNTPRLIRRNILNNYNFSLTHLINLIKDHFAFWDKCKQKTSPTTTKNIPLPSNTPSSTPGTSFISTTGTNFPSTHQTNTFTTSISQISTPILTSSTILPSHTNITSIISTRFSNSTTTPISNSPIITTTLIETTSPISNLSCYHQNANSALDSATKALCKENEKYCYVNSFILNRV
jgi:hypothetical protein